MLATVPPLADDRRREPRLAMWPVVITAVIVIPLLVLAWWQLRRR
jgi:cytochrome oxidase assembly protein ShyY1